MKTLILIVILTLVSLSFAAELPCKVQYVSVNTVYLSAGRAAGISPGDSVVLSRDGVELARTSIGFVAENSSSCDVPDAARLIGKEDVAVVSIAAPASAAETESAAQEQLESELAESSAPKQTARPADRPNQLTGRIGVDYTMQDDREPQNYDYTQPGLSVRATLKRISGSDFSARTNLRLRRTVRANDDLSSSSHRIYEAMLAYEPAEKPLTAGVGRLNLHETRGMGYFDGAYVKFAASKTVGIGVVGGFEPDPENTRIQTDRTKIGAFVAFGGTVGPSQYLQATASIAGRYLEGEVSREFVYQQISYSYGSRLRLFESTELNVNRDWLKDAEGSSFTLASLLLDARYSLSRALTLTAAYDNRTPYYTAETRTLPDSIFNSALQQGYRAGLETRFADTYSADAGLGIRASESQESSASSAWIRIGSTNLADTRLRTFARLRWFDSDHSSGIQPSLNLSRDLTKWLDAGLEFGMNDYELTGSPDRISQKWIALLLDVVPARQTYLSAEFEQGFGEGRETTLLRLAFGYRF